MSGPSRIKKRKEYECWTLIRLPLVVGIRTELFLSMVILLLQYWSYTFIFSENNSATDTPESELPNYPADAGSGHYPADDWFVEYPADAGFPDFSSDSRFTVYPTEATKPTPPPVFGRFGTYITFHLSLLVVPAVDAFAEIADVMITYPLWASQSQTLHTQWRGPIMIVRSRRLQAVHHFIFVWASQRKSNKYRLVDISSPDEQQQ